MRKRILIVLGCCFFLIGLLLLLGFVLVQGINDGEWGHIRETGNISDLNLIVWSDWQPIRGVKIQQFSLDEYQLQDQGDLEFRKGIGRGMLFDFTAYECRKADGNMTKIVPAIGPGWGASYHGIWSFVSLSIGTTLLLLAILVRDPMRGQ
jgi:hypothetical protein